MSNYTQTIQMTSKKLKKQLAIVIAFTIAGVVLMIISTGAHGNVCRTIGITLTIGGLIGVGIMKIKIWWHHK